MKTAYTKCFIRQSLRAVVTGVLLIGLGNINSSAAAADDSDPLLVFAAASLAPVLESATGYLKQQAGAEVRISYAASAVLARQIASGAPADIFISANRRWIDWLEKAGELQGAETHAFARNQLVIAFGAGSVPTSRDPVAILSSSQTVATADPEIAPLGRYAQEAIDSYGLTEALEGRMLWAQDARSALALVETGAAEIGILYASDAEASHRVTRMVPIPEARHTPIVYVAMLLARERPTAQGLMQALSGAGMAPYLKQSGLLPPEPE